MFCVWPVAEHLLVAVCICSPRRWPQLSCPSRWLFGRLHARLLADRRQSYVKNYHFLCHHRVYPHPVDVTLSADHGRADCGFSHWRSAGRGGDFASACAQPGNRAAVQRPGALVVSARHQSGLRRRGEYDDGRVGNHDAGSTAGRPDSCRTRDVQPEHGVDEFRAVSDGGKDQGLAVRLGKAVLGKLGRCGVQKHTARHCLCLAPNGPAARRAV